jgi:heat shock protein HtpX
VGLFTAAIFGVFMVLTNDRVARRILHVIPLESQDYPWLQAKIAELSKKLVVPTPNVGLIEDLRPNAFIIGYGENATVVFSIGLLNILSQDEAAAVASHEIAHIKNHDFFYKVVSSTLTMVSFFNPATYFVSSAAQREREMFADQGAIDILEKPSVFGDALAKIGNSLEALSKESLRTSLSSNLFASSSVLHRVSILSTHPRLNKRLRNISKSNSKTRLSRIRIGLTVFALTLVLVCCMLASSSILGMSQSSYSYVHLQMQPTDVNSTDYSFVGNSSLIFSSPVALSAVNGSMVTVPTFEVSPVSSGVAFVSTGSVALSTASNDSALVPQYSLSFSP